MPHTHVHRLLLAFLLLAGLGACRAAETGTTPPAYTLVLLRTGPRSGQLPPDENTRAFQGHFANMERMAKEHQLLVAGPYGERRHDLLLRGIFVLATGDRDRAERWARTDPTTQAGVFSLEFHELVTDAPLAAALERGLARLAAAEAEGRKPEPGEGARPYVLLTTEHFEPAERELAELRTRAGGVLLLGRLDGEQGFAILEAKDLDEAQEHFGPWLENVGPYLLDEWFASNELLGMVD